MSTLPLSFRVRNAVVEKHQLEGTDPSERYFNRLMPVKRVDRGYTTSVMYEALTVESDTHQTVHAAIADVVAKLQEFGFTKIRTRVNFKGQRYLAEKESWIDYPDS
ncbi:MAG: hypothetical protein MRJ96_03230 [Nitrospirales bacterium]|nr:hypothetical protein [Nitrospira sp.]MDR4500451.1 hypothetical protein [Nitrospirales bacterium]